MMNSFEHNKNLLNSINSFNLLEKKDITHQETQNKLQI